MSLLDDASLILTPNGYKGGSPNGKLYSVKPTSGLGDMVVSRNTTATRVNSLGLIESVAINVPRLDYPPLGGCPSILVEPLRTNLVLQSQTLENASWSKTIGGTGIAPVVTANAGTAPDGTMTADRVQFNCVGSLSADRSLLVQGSLVTTITTRYYQSIYVKAFSPSEVGKELRISSDGMTSSIITITANWQRIVLNGLATFNPSNFIVETRGGVGGTANTTADVLLWGAQMEAGLNATSYIPTTTLIAGVTRNDDVITKTGISSLIGQSEGTIFWDVKDLVGSVSPGNPEFTIRNTAFSNWIGITTNTSANPFRITVRTSTPTIIIDYSANITSAKACVKYGTFGAKLFLNGNPTPVATSLVNPNFSFDNILFRGSLMSYKTNLFALWTTALSDAQCKDLTT